MLTVAVALMWVTIVWRVMATVAPEEKVSIDGCLIGMTIFATVLGDILIAYVRYVLGGGC